MMMHTDRLRIIWIGLNKARSIGIKKFMDCLNSLTKELVEADIRKEVGSWRSSSSSLDEG